MSARIALVLVILLVVLGGGALFYQQQERERRPENAASLGRVLLKDLQAADIAAIRIVEPKASLTVRRTETGWVIPERGNFPADLGKVREFALLLIGLKIGQSEPITEADRARLNLDASGTQLELGGADGKALAALSLGKKYFKREVENADKAPGDGRFVALPGEAKMVYVVSDPLVQASTRSADWIDRASFKVEKVKTLDVRFPDGAQWRIERKGDNADWKLAGLKPREKLDVGRANAASYSLSLLELADVAPKSATGTGLERPILINATTLDGGAYAIKVGRLQGEDYFVSFTSAKANDKEALLAHHLLLIPKSRLDDTLKKRAELLEKTNPKK